MKLLVLNFVIFTLISSCAQFKERDRQRKIQTVIISKITNNASIFSACAKESKLFKALKKERIRVVLFLSIASNGQVEKFKLDNKKYPSSFSECIFKATDKISFPKMRKNELIELEQPFIFSKK